MGGSTKIRPNCQKGPKRKQLEPKWLRKGNVEIGETWRRTVAGLACGQASTPSHLSAKFSPSDYCFVFFPTSRQYASRYSANLSDLRPLWPISSLFGIIEFWSSLVMDALIATFIAGILPADAAERYPSAHAIIWHSFLLQLLISPQQKIPLSLHRRAVVSIFTVFDLSVCLFRELARLLRGVGRRRFSLFESLHTFACNWPPLMKSVPFPISS